MSVHLTSPIWRLGITSSAKMVFLCLGDYANPQGVAWPAIHTIALETGYNRRTVQRVIAQLIDDAVILPLSFSGGGKGKSTVYKIDIERAQDCYPPFPRGASEDQPMSPLHRYLADRPPQPKGGVVPPFEDFKGRSGAALSDPKGGPEYPKGGPEYPKGGPVPPKPLEPLEPLNDSVDDTAASPPGGGDGLVDNEKQKKSLSNEWQGHQGKFRSAIGDELYDVWMKPAIVENFDGKTLVISLPTRLMVDYVRNQWHDMIRSAYDCEVVEFVEFDHSRRQHEARIARVG